MKIKAETGIKNRAEEAGLLLREYRGALICSVILAVVSYGYQLILSNGLTHIDTATLVSIGDGFYESWFSYGRYGLVWMKRLFGVTTYNPYIANVLTAVFLAVFGFLFYVIIAQICKKHEIRVSRWTMVALFPMLASPISTPDPTVKPTPVPTRTPVNPTPVPSGYPSGSPKTGDNSMAEVWMILMICGLSGAAVSAVVYRRRKRNSAGGR